MASPLEGAKHRRTDNNTVASSNLPTVGYIPASPGTSSGKDIHIKGTGNKRGRKALAIALGIICVVLVIVYGGGVWYFTNHFMPNSSLGILDVSMMEADQAETALAEEVSDYTLDISGDDFEATYTADDIGLSLDADEVVSAALEQENAWLWPFQCLGSHDVSEALVMTHNKDELDTTLSAAIDTFNETATQPVDADIAYDETSQKFAITSEEAGTALNKDAVLAAVNESIIAFQTEVVLGEEELSHPSVYSDDTRLKTALDTANTMIQTSFSVTAGDSLLVESSPDLIASWITISENIEAGISDDAISAWSSEVSSDCNTVGTTRTYTRPDGKTITVSGGSYGWSVDTGSLAEQVKEMVTSGSGGTVDLPYTQTAAQMVEQGQADWGNRYIDVDLAEQHVYFYIDGSLVWEADCVSGTPNGKDDTSVGVYYIENKESPSTLIGYENGEKIYESEVQYWMPFDRNMVGLHDADWQSAFGGTRYADGYGSHGCVNLPVDAAAELYNLVQIGDPVISHW